MKREIILASASPRRNELLKIITDEFKVIPSTIEENVPDTIPVLKVPEFLAELKAKDVAQSFPDSIVIGSDTAVIVDDKILGKPKSRKDAYDMISLLSGKTHFVVTGCSIVCGKTAESFSCITEVEFNNLSENDINDYIDTPEPYDKAGAYGIQGKGALLVKKINGDYFNVVGLPISMLNSCLKKMSGI
ncbi:MAG: septum formation protein Maf [Clostridia bacterium]|nr:septum formation protein Maf [Clostridia bacterium]